MYLNNIGACVPPVIALAFVYVIQIDGKSIAIFKDSVKNIPIGLLIFTACVTVLGAAVNLENVGISVWISNLLSPMLSGLPNIVIIGLLTVAAMVLTQFMSNTVTIYLIYAVAIALLSDSGLNLAAVVILVTLSAGIGIMTPAAAVPSPLFFGPEHLTVKSFAKYGFIYLILNIIALMIIIYPLASRLIQL